MANVCLILGKTGSGKTTSLQTLDPKSTVVFNVLKKRLPFKGSNSSYNTENKNIYYLDTYNDIVTYLNNLGEKAHHVKNVILDDLTYIMRKEYFATAKINGFNKFVDIASHFQSIIATAENLREDLNIFLIMHAEDITSDNIIVGYKPSTIGKMIDSSYNPMEVVPMCLFASVEYDETKKPIYGFYTQRCLKGTVEIPAKSPAGMFEDEFIPNDLAFVCKKMEEYYN